MWATITSTLAGLVSVALQIEERIKGRRRGKRKRRKR